MKSLFKILTPIISTIGIATISLTSCGTTASDGLVAIPKDMLDIDGTTLKGLKAPYEKITGYNKLTVPKEIEVVNPIQWEQFAEGLKAITKIDFESGSNCKTISTISALPNLTTIVFPPKLSTINGKILKCQKINTIDISNVINIDYLVNNQWIEYDGTLDYPSGTLIIRKDQVNKVADIKSKNHCLNKFEIKNKG